MRKLLCLMMIAVICQGCVIKGPWTGSKYEIGANEDQGLFISVKPMDSDIITNTMIESYEWLIEE
jgi:hypothetical protein